jgi:hypothetical protein
MAALNYAIGWCLFLAIAIGSMLMGNAYLTGAQGAEFSAQQAESQYTIARVWAENTLATYVQNNPNSAVASSAFGTWSSSDGNATATVTVQGDTVAGGTQTSFANIQQNAAINERRVALDLTVKQTQPTPSVITHRLVYRVYHASPFVSYLGEEDVGSASDRTITAGADNGGCAGSGAGCDTNGVQAADDQRLGAGLSCVIGSNSGTCPGGGVFDKSQYGNGTWNNGQTGEGQAP